MCYDSFGFVTIINLSDGFVELKDISCLSRRGSMGWSIEPDHTKSFVCQWLYEASELRGAPSPSVNNKDARTFVSPFVPLDHFSCRVKSKFLCKRSSLFLLVGNRITQWSKKDLDEIPVCERGCKLFKPGKYPSHYFQQKWGLIFF